MNKTQDKEKCWDDCTHVAPEGEFKSGEQEQSLDKKITNQNFRGDIGVDYSFIYTKDVKSSIQQTLRDFDKYKRKSNTGDFVLLSVEDFDAIFKRRFGELGK